VCQEERKEKRGERWRTGGLVEVGPSRRVVEG
jgi:hypothetical protein